MLMHDYYKNTTEQNQTPSKLCLEPQLHNPTIYNFKKP